MSYVGYVRNLGYNGFRFALPSSTKKIKTFIHVFKIHSLFIIKKARTDKDAFSLTHTLKKVIEKFFHSPFTSVFPAE